MKVLIAFLILLGCIDIFSCCFSTQSYYDSAPPKDPESDMANVQFMTSEVSTNETPDPFMIKYNGTYILTFTTGNRVELWRSSLLHDFHDNVAAKRIIWFHPCGTLELTDRRPEDANLQMSDIWAPELHIVDDYW